MKKLVIQSEGVASNILPFSNEIGVCFKATGNYDHTINKVFWLRIVSSVSMTGKCRIVKPNGDTIESDITYNNSALVPIKPDVDLNKGEKYYIFYSFNEGIEKINTLIFAGQGSMDNLGFVTPFLYLSNAKNIETLGFNDVDASIENSGEDFDIYNVSLFPELKTFNLSSSYGMANIIFGDFINIPLLETIHLGKLSNVNIGSLLHISKDIVEFHMIQMADPIDNDFSLLTNTNVKRIQINSNSSYYNNALWKGGRELIFKNSIESVYTRNGIATNADIVDFLICLSNSNFDNGATVDMTINIDNTDAELVAAINRLKTKCTLILNNEIVN